jgi:cytochrome c peroxidase
MWSYISLAWIALSGVLAATTLLSDVSAEPASNALRTPDPSGTLASVSTRGTVLDRDNPFFESLGTNSRACVTCHVPSEDWSISAADVRRRFDLTAGRDPLFRTVDGSNSPNADISTPAARRRAYSMLLSKGVIRVGIGMPTNAEFELVRSEDPYAFASAAELSLFRRPLPSTNLGFLNTVMWDGRETLQQLSPTSTPEQNHAALRFDLSDQANGATRGHAQAARDLTDAERRQIVDFETALFTAQVVDDSAGSLRVRGAAGGPGHLAEQPFFVGINDLVASGAAVVPPDPGATLFSAWASPRYSPEQQAIARGETLFNSRPITITGVAGLNDALGLPTIRGTCTTCHNTPNVGNHSTAAPLNIGIADASRRTPDLPLYTLRNKATGELRQTTDPGRALITGKWSDVGKFKGPVLRGLAARAPYFHNGSAATLRDVVDFYNTRFSIGLRARERADLIAFLEAL